MNQKAQNKNYSMLHNLLDSVNAKSKETLGERKTFTVDDKEEKSYAEQIEIEVELYERGKSLKACAGELKMSLNKFRGHLDRLGVALRYKDRKQRNISWDEIVALNAA